MESTTVHPRERGEHEEPEARAEDPVGSSPRARGTLGMVGPSVRRDRFIPASAGNTRLAFAGGVFASVHPRERGEHFEYLPTEIPAAGSSPRARGTHILTPVHRAAIRFIPASAGNTRGQMRRKMMITVHPRERGEHTPFSLDQAVQGGSSPRARGTRGAVLAVGFLARFIPASAGNTRAGRCTSTRSAVHPRERGEHKYPRESNQFAGGSSPRARGTPCGRRRRCWCGRFIPASAGNTPDCYRVGPATAVHPRERGEHVTRADGRLDQLGSSPRARGTPVTPRQMQGVGRFIPASAGNT